jgi:hypothetical protein
MKSAIGTVTLEYTQQGELITSLFEPTMTVSLDSTLESELRKIECCASPEDLEHNASLVLASYFNRMNKIELRDVATTSLSGHIDHLEKHENGNIKKAVISYSFDDGK